MATTRTGISSRDLPLTDDVVNLVNFVKIKVNDHSFDKKPMCISISHNYIKICINQCDICGSSISALLSVFICTFMYSFVNFVKPIRIFFIINTINPNCNVSIVNKDIYNFIFGFIACNNLVSILGVITLNIYSPIGLCNINKICLS